MEGLLNSFSSMSPQFIQVIMWLIFGVAFILWALFSAVLIFHWRRYGMKKRLIVLGEILYMAVSVIVILITLSSIIAFT